MVHGLFMSDSTFYNTFSSTYFNMPVWNNVSVHFSVILKNQNFFNCFFFYSVLTEIYFTLYYFIYFGYSTFLERV